MKAIRRLTILLILFLSLLNPAIGARSQQARTTSTCAQTLSGLVIAAAACLSGCSQITHQDYRYVYQQSVNQERDDIAEEFLLARERDFELHIEDIREESEKLKDVLAQEGADRTLKETQAYYEATGPFSELRRLLFNFIEARAIYDRDLLQQRTGGNVFWANRTYQVKTWPTFHQLYSYPGFHRPDLEFKLNAMASFGIGLAYAGPEALVAFFMDAFRPFESVGPWDGGNQQSLEEARVQMLDVAEDLEQRIRSVPPKFFNRAKAGPIMFQPNGFVALYLEAVSLQRSGAAPAWSADAREAEVENFFLSEGNAANPIAAEAEGRPSYHFTPMLFADRTSDPRSLFDRVIDASIQLEEAHPVEHRTGLFKASLQEAIKGQQISSWHLFAGLKYLASRDGRVIYEKMGDAFFERGELVYASFAYSMASRVVVLERGADPQAIEARLRRKLTWTMDGVDPINAFIGHVTLENLNRSLASNDVLTDADIIRFIVGADRMPQEVLFKEKSPYVLTLRAALSRLFHGAPTLRDRLAAYENLDYIPLRDQLTTNYMQVITLQEFVKVWGKR